MSFCSCSGSQGVQLLWETRREPDVVCAFRVGFWRASRNGCATRVDALALALSPLGCLAPMIYRVGRSAFLLQDLSLFFHLQRNQRRNLLPISLILVSSTSLGRSKSQGISLDTSFDSESYILLSFASSLEPCPRDSFFKRTLVRIFTVSSW